MRMIINKNIVVKAIKNKGREKRGGKIQNIKPRLTKQRKIILDELKKVCSHPTAEEIHKMVAKKMPQISLATVYRNLDFLVKSDQILKLNSKDKKARYDGTTDKHLHLICKKCGKVMDIFDCRKLIIESEQLKTSGFKVGCDYLEIPGRCKKCANR